MQNHYQREQQTLNKKETPSIPEDTCQAELQFQFPPIWTGDRDLAWTTVYK